MIYFLALIPATMLSIAGYFVIYLSNRSEGTFQKFGKYLGFWAFTLAGLVIVGAIFAAAHGGRDGARFGMRGARGWMHSSWANSPRYLGPREEERRDTTRPGETRPGAAPQASAGAANPPSPPPPPPR
jgi:hypothetical protein